MKAWADCSMNNQVGKEQNKKGNRGERPYYHN